MRDWPLWLAFRCGPPAPDFLPAHAHADAHWFQLWGRGRPVLVDAGTFTYEAGADRDWFRSTCAHSTVRVDGRDQFRLWGAFRSGRLPKVSLRYARERAVEASVVLPGRVRHLRRIERAADAAEVFVHDQLEGKGRHRVESRLVWAPHQTDVEVELLGRRGAVDGGGLGVGAVRRACADHGLGRTNRVGTYGVHGVPASLRKSPDGAGLERSIALPRSGFDTSVRYVESVDAATRFTSKNCRVLHDGQGDLMVDIAREPAGELHGSYREGLANLDCMRALLAAQGFFSAHGSVFDRDGHLLDRQRAVDLSRRRTWPKSR
jgi:hypothetical protein